MSIDHYHLAVLLGCMSLLMILVIQGRSVLVVAPLCAFLAALFSGADPLAQLTGPYMTGFADYLRRFYLIFALGAVFGKLMEQSGAAISIANGVAHALGTQRACLAVVLSCALLTYGGVSLFVVGFSVYPLAVHLFRSANLPRQFIPAAIAFGSITFTMTSAGSPEIQNLIPIKYLVDTSGHPLTDARAGWQVSLIVSFLMFVCGQLYLDWCIRRAIQSGEKFEPRKTDRTYDESSDVGPGFLTSICPLGATLLVLDVLPGVCHFLAKDPAVRPYDWLRTSLASFPDDGTLAILIGVIVAAITLGKWLQDGWGCFGDGFFNGLLAGASTAAVVGFGESMKGHPGFQRVVDWVTHLPGDPLMSAALAVAVIAAIAGSASGGQGIALPIIKPIYVDELGVSPRALHRVVSIASGTLDSLPANGYIVMLIRTICGETHARAYPPIFVTTVLIPAAGTCLAIALFKLMPQWAFP